MTTHNVNFTKDEAAAFSFALDEAQRSCVRAIDSIKRKRSWRDSEKAMAAAEISKRLDLLTKLNDRIQRAAQIRGY